MNWATQGSSGKIKPQTSDWKNPSELLWQEKLPASQEKKAQMKEQIKAPEKIELSDEEIVNLSDAEFKTLVIRRLTEWVEYCHKIEEKVKAMKSEIKENLEGTNSDGKETRTQINDLEQKEE